MTPWITLTPADIDDYLVGAQVAALRTAALSAGQSDPVDEAITAITSEIRNYIRSCPSNVLSLTPGTIPPELKRHACALIIEAAQPRLKLKLSDDQRTAADNARKLLDKIAACRYAVAAPLDPQTTPSDQAATLKPSIAQNQTHRLKADGL